MSDAKALSGSLDIAEAQKLLTISKTVKPIIVRVVDTTFAVAFDQLLKSILQSRFAVVCGLFPIWLSVSVNEVLVQNEEAVVLNRISSILEFICNIVQITIGDVFLFEDVQEQSFSVF